MTAPGPLLLLIEDEPQMLRFLRASLGTHGYRLAEAQTGADGLAQAAQRNPEVILLDLGLPDMDGLEVTRRLREWTRTPVIVLSARGQDEDKINALDAGADDYLTKPFSVGELLARIRVALRHAASTEPGSESPSFVLGELRIDFVKRQVFVQDREVHLTPPSIGCCRCWPGTRAACSPTASSSRTFGARLTRSTPSTCACSSGSYDTSSSKIPRDHATCSTSPAWGIG